MPTFVGLKQNSPAKIIPSKNYRTELSTTQQQSQDPHDQGHHCLRKVKLRQDKNSYVKIKIEK